MSRSTPYVIVLSLLAGTAAHAGGPTHVPPPNASRTTLSKIQVGGAITWKGNVALKPGSGDSCSHFKVRVVEPTPGQSSPGGISVPGNKDLGVSAVVTGNIKQGSCKYAIASGVPEDKTVLLSASYDGAMGGAADQKSGSSAPFSLGAGKAATKNLEVVFTQIH